MASMSKRTDPEPILSGEPGDMEALRSTVTTPAGVGAGVGAGAGAGAGVGAAAVGAMSLEPNAWTEHDLGGGDEGEIEMSFE